MTGNTSCHIARGGKKRVSVNHIMQRERLLACVMVILIPECYMLSCKPIELHVSCIFTFVLPHCAFCINCY